MSTQKDCHGNPVAASALKEYTISAPGIKATFIPYGARLVSLVVSPSNSTPTEVAVGYASPSSYVSESAPSYYGAAIGRIGNRIAHGKFSVSGTEYSITCNEHSGQNTLHGGRVGYDAREWTVLSATESSVTFQLKDEGFEGFPGSVQVTAQYAVQDNELKTTLSAVPLDKATPIALTTHGYYNLAGSGPVLDDTLQLPTATRFVRGDDILVPTGETPSVAGSPLDFTSAKTVGEGMSAQECGKGAHGIDNCFCFDKVGAEKAQLIWTSRKSGIRLQLFTNQPAVQIYSCNASPEATISKEGEAGCLAIEPQGWIDAVNHPQWGQKTIYAPGEVYVNESRWKFDLVK